MPRIKLYHMPLLCIGKFQERMENGISIGLKRQSRIGSLFSALEEVVSLPAGRPFN